MQRVRWIALQGRSRGYLPPLLLLFQITTSGIPAHAADDPAACSSRVARIVSIQGTIEVLRAHQNDWSKVTRLDTPLCEGDRLRTGPLSRAALFIQPETLVRADQNTSISVSQTKDETLVEFTQEDVLPAAASAYSCGAGYFITRFPRKFRVNTPHLNAAVEGTEFLVAMRCEATELSVFEGKVLAAGTADNIFPAQSISSGQILTIGGSEPPTVKLLVKPTDAVQWVVYYPPLSDAMAEADLPPAEQCRTLPKPLDQTCLTQRAEALLRLGRVDEAQREVDEAVALDPGRGDANALRAIISIARNDKAGAMEAATAATTASPNSSRAWLALSYAQQASFKLEESLSSARKGQALEPNSSVTNARIAELLMSLGRIKKAEKAARAAVDANPSESRAHTVLGFVHLAQIKTKEARADFLAAIERDSSDPLPRLGLGLAIIRDGKLADGREQLEIAVALDPNNSLLRSYVGKVYYVENTSARDNLAATQFDLAKRLDPNDPTPWFYAAILEQSQNRPVEALKQLKQSAALNDNRAVYRSRLLLDQDNAAKSASAARAYADLGFSQLALLEGYKAVTADPTNFSAHEFLSNAYSSLPRHQISQVSELMQSQLRQPLRIDPAAPQKSEAKLFIPTGSGSVPPGPNEWTLLTERSGANLLLDALAGGMDTLSGQATLAGMTGPFAISAGAFSYRTDGFRENNDFSRELQNVFLQASLTPNLSAQIELRKSFFEFGDLPLRFDPQNVRTTRQSQDTESARFGARYVISPESDIVLSVISQSGDFVLTIPGFGSIVDVPKSTLIEAQGLSQFGPLRITLGGSQLRGKLNETFLGFPNAETTQEQTTGYAYANFAFEELLSNLQVGVSVTDLKEPNITRRETSPKAGVIVSLSPRTTLRGAYFEDVHRILPTNQTIEPTQIAGFNQFFDDVDGTIAVHRGIGLDYEIGRSAYVGIEYSDRDLTVPVIDFFLGTTRDVIWNEALSRAYFYWTPRSKLAISTEAFWEQYERPLADPGIEGFYDLRSIRTPLTVSVFPNERWSARAVATYWRQEGGFIDVLGAPLNATEDFVVLDAQVSYRFPRRRGALTVGANNIGDSKHRYQEVDPATPRYIPQRMFYVRLSLAL